MKEHTKNMLLKQARNNVQDSNARFDIIPPRFAIRGASAQIISIFAEHIDNYLSKFKLGSSSSLEAVYTQYADGTDTTFTINNRQLNIQDVPVGDFFDAVPDTIITIIATNNPPPPIEPGLLDAGYSHDVDNEDDFGEIEVMISLPKSPHDAIEFLVDKHIEIQGLLAHEMQHAIQKIVMGYKLPNGMTSTLREHATDYFEIDARIEEVIAMMPHEIDEDNIVEFKRQLDVCLDNYLTRNVQPSDDIELLKEEMMASHIDAYKLKMKNY